MRFKMLLLWRMYKNIQRQNKRETSMHILVQLNCFSSLNTPYNKKKCSFFLAQTLLWTLRVFMITAFIRRLHGLKNYKTSAVGVTLLTQCFPPRITNSPTMNVSPTVPHFDTYWRNKHQFNVFRFLFFFSRLCGTFRALLFKCVSICLGYRVNTRRERERKKWLDNKEHIDSNWTKKKGRSWK